MASLIFFGSCILDNKILLIVDLKSDVGPVLIPLPSA